MIEFRQPESALRRLRADIYELVQDAVEHLDGRRRSLDDLRDIMRITTNLYALAVWAEGGGEIQLVNIGDVPGDLTALAARMLSIASRVHAAATVKCGLTARHDSDVSQLVP